MGELVQHPPDDASSHRYEVKKVHMDGSTFDAVVFYLRAGEPVNINVEGVLKNTNLWVEPSDSNPKLERRFIFEVAPQDDEGPVELYFRRLDVELNKIEELQLSFYGFRPIPAGGSSVTNELVNELREKLGI